jgi:hypothetical protein
VEVEEAVEVAIAAHGGGGCGGSSD